MPRDGRQAVEWFRNAAAQGDAQAEYRLGARFVDGSDGLPEDPARGLALMERAGEHRYLRSFYLIGDYYRTGWHAISEDAAKAVEWFRRGADLGDASSQRALGFAYQYGRGVTNDIGGAISWYQKAADQDDFLSQQWLGQIYEYGEGVEADKVIALCWYRKAALQNNRFKMQAQQSVARLESQVSTSADMSSCR